jgi:hypothetical protein
MRRVEQHGCRKVADSTFMASVMFRPTPTRPTSTATSTGSSARTWTSTARPSATSTTYLNEIPQRYHESIDVGGFGPGERVVFLPYTEEMYKRAQRWMQERGLFDERVEIPAYETVVQI